jgi:peptidoglycan/xylan/chitin deacetylase (PgdA/CDA1 family)
VKPRRTLLVGLAVCVLSLAVGWVFLPTILGTLNPGVIYRIPDAGRTLYLTLDDGPSESTPRILDVLRKHEVRATFFITADHIRPELMRRIVADGHQVAHHLKTTRSLDRLTDDEFHADFQTADKALATFQSVKLFRPPGGSISTERTKYVHAQGYAVVVGTVYPLDHWLESEGLIKLLTKALVTDGGIIILHDTSVRGCRTAAVLDRLIPELKQDGYRFALLPAEASKL